MIEPIPFEASRFRTAAAHYLPGRPPYTAALVARVAQLARLTRAHSVLDLGCGPGQLARAFAPLAAHVLAIDPEPEMLRVARAQGGDANIEYRQGSSYDLSLALGSFHLVVMGRSFHWMDRVETLRRLDAMMPPGGAVALFHDTYPDVPDNAWRRTLRAVRERYAKGYRPQREPGWIRHEAVLLDSAFAHLETIGVTERRAIDTATLAEQLLSMSSTSRAHIGEQADAMLADLHAAFDGMALREVITTEALVAWRTDPS